METVNRIVNYNPATGRFEERLDEEIVKHAAYRARTYIAEGMSQRNAEHHAFVGMTDREKNVARDGLNALLQIVGLPSDCVECDSPYPHRSHMRG